MKSKFITFLTCLGIVFGGYLLFKILKATGPEAQQRVAKPMQVLVEVMPLKQSDTGVRIEGMGAVIAAREVMLKAQVGGKVVEVAPQLLEGKHVKAGTILSRVEADDYALKLAQAESTLAMRAAELELEMGFQRVAEREWELLKDSDELTAGNGSLALREPQLKQAQAMERSAASALEQAKLDLARTETKAPFNAMVLSKKIEVGSLAGQNSNVASLVSTDSFHIRVSIPVGKVSILDIPGAKALVRIDGLDTNLPGRAVSLLGDLDPDGRMARVLVEVEDPLALKPENAQRPKLLLGSYVEVELLGDEIPNTYVIPRNTLRNGDFVWLASPDSTLEIRPVEVVWKNRDTVVVRGGLKEGEQLITSSLSFAAAGMAVQVSGAEASRERKKKQPPNAAK